jgi:queuine tRNA-ribosyltransferase
MCRRSLKFTIEASCSRTRARAGTILFRDTTDPDKYLPDLVKTPVFMPVGTGATLKGLLPDQVQATGCRLMLCNTYHMAIRPGIETIRKAGGVHKCEYEFVSKVWSSFFVVSITSYALATRTPH